MNDDHKMKIFVTVRDAVSGCYDEKILSFNLSQSARFKETFFTLKSSIGSFFDEFDKKEQIHFTLEILSVKLEHERD